MYVCTYKSVFFFFNDTATTEIYTLSLHDALPISPEAIRDRPNKQYAERNQQEQQQGDRKSTRLNSSHSQISYAVFCLKKKKIAINIRLILTSTIDFVISLLIR